MKAKSLLVTVGAPVLLLALLLGACAAHGLRCDGPLQPINSPAPDPVPAHPGSDDAQ